MWCIRRLSSILRDVEDIEVSDNGDNAEAIKALKSALYDVIDCLGEYISDHE